MGWLATLQTFAPDCPPSPVTLGSHLGSSLRCHLCSEQHFQSEWCIHLSPLLSVLRPPRYAHHPILQVKKPRLKEGWWLGQGYPSSKEHSPLNHSELRPGRDRARLGRDTCSLVLAGPLAPVWSPLGLGVSPAELVTFPALLASWAPGSSETGTRKPQGLSQYPLCPNGHRPSLSFLPDPRDEQRGPL